MKKYAIELLVAIVVCQIYLVVYHYLGIEEMIILIGVAITGLYLKVCDFDFMLSFFTLFQIKDAMSIDFSNCF